MKLLPFAASAAVALRFARLLPCIGAAVFSLGCASAAKTVASFQNNYDFRIARYLETCQVQQPPAPCKEQQLVLNRYEKALHEAAVALKWGGKMPLQIKALKTWDKAASK